MRSMDPANPRNPYSPLKVLAHRGLLQQLKAHAQIVPVQAQVVLSDFCNHNCSFCAYRMNGFINNEKFGVMEDGVRNNNPTRFMPTPKAVELFDDFRNIGVRAVQFTGGGEPTVHPDHTELFNNALDRGLECALITNGYTLREDDFDVLHEFSWVRVSVDAGSAAQYAAIRDVPESGWERMWGNFRRLVKDNADGHGPLLGAGFVVTRENFESMVAFAKRAKAEGANNVRISAMFNPDQYAYFHPIREEVLALAEDTMALEDESFRVFNEFNARLDDLKQKSPDYDFCGYQQFVTYIGADLNVYRCCDTAYSERGLLGSIKDQSFATFWNSLEKRRLIDDFDAHDCGSCMFNTRNRFINYAIAPSHTHVNFV